MRRLAALAAALAALLMVGAARAEQLIVALSTNEIRIDSDFTGASVTVFGVIERDAVTVSRAASYEVAVLLRGQPESVVARRKDPILGIWINRASEVFIAAPSFYALNTSKPLGDVSTGPLLGRFGIGLDNIGFKYAERATVNDPAAAEFRDAFVRLKQKAGLYTENTSAVDFMGGAVFRSALRIPANVPTGNYRLTVYLFSGDVLLAQAEDTIRVTKTGFEQFMFTAAHQRAALYGLACVFLALFTGWLAGVIFRRD